MAYVEKEMNLKRASVEYKVTQPTENFAIPFEFVEAEQNLRVRLNGIDINDLGYSFLVTNNITVQVTPAIPHGILRISRETNIDENLYKFTAGALFEARTMDKNFEQIRHSQQETRDGFDKLAGDVYPLVNGLEVALEKADEASKVAQEAADAAEVAAQVTRSTSQVFDANGLSQQDINDSSKLLSANVLDFFTKSELTAWKADPNAFDSSDAIIRAQTLSSGAEINFPSGTFRITKKIPSSKSWRGVRGGYTKRGTHIIVDNPVAIDGVIDCSVAHVAVELHDIQFEDKQRLLHTLLIEGVYQGFYSGIRVDHFKLGIQTSGTYVYFEKCYFIANGVGIRPTPTANVGNAQSTMFGCRECFFIYNDIGYDISGVSAADDLINVPFISCGFELNRIGLNSPNRTWYLTLLNCWFEANSDYGLYAPTSHLIEINTRHNANSPFVVSPTVATKIFGMTASFVDLEIKGDVTSNIKFPDEYSSTGEAAKGKTISQTFTDDGGGVTAEIAFVREKTNNNYGGSGIEFSTAVSTTSPTMYARWGISRYGVLYPKVDATYSIGNPTSRCSAVYTTKVMYNANVGDFAGSGSPEGVVSAYVGSTYRRLDGAANQPVFYVKKLGLGATGWVGIQV